MLPRGLSLVFVLFFDLCATCVALSHMKVKFSQYATAYLIKKFVLAIHNINRNVSQFIFEDFIISCNY